MAKRAKKRANERVFEKNALKQATKTANGRIFAKTVSKTGEGYSGVAQKKGALISQRSRKLATTYSSTSDAVPSARAGL
ncbi:MAG: hypothetical protein KBS89_00050, partial [Bacteroidales bacterium]|nr:hypothetical protein [Candidatus Egerieousia equi]